MSEKRNEVSVSVIIPVMNEVENVEILAREVREAMESTKYSWVCVWVDDLSTDGTVEKIREIRAADKRNRLIRHTANFGQSAALATGFRHADGSIFVTLDGDGQNDPSSIPALLDKLTEEDADMVNGWREKRNDNLVRRMSSKIANAYRNALTGESIRDVGCALRAFKRECVDEIPVFKGM
ncbi:MAG: glycosyltransferase family 2 protein, partial [Victivallales bacterium]|nr:glycosyltransferase family 2 protein [Victivallales bacterium]